MCNEWRENIWLIIGLAIVSIAIWLLGLSMDSAIASLLEPRGFDPENVVIAQFPIKVPTISTMARSLRNYIFATGKRFWQRYARVHMSRQLESAKTHCPIFSVILVRPSSGLM